ncbi:MAG: hypothetical protein V1913_18815 [Fibrobacterota bacterium]
MGRRQLMGALLGAGTGVLDLIPMVIQRLSWDACASAFSLWVISGFLISNSTLTLRPMLKGILISFLVLFPSAVLIGAQSPQSLVPISAMTLILGGLLGFTVGKTEK